MPQTNSLQGKEINELVAKIRIKTLAYLSLSCSSKRPQVTSVHGVDSVMTDFKLMSTLSKKQVKNKATQGDIKSSIGALFYNFLVLLLPGNNLSTNLYQQLFKASSNRIFS